jgi:hypothetical protein
MTASLALNDILVWSLQIGFLVALAAILPPVLGLKMPKACAASVGPLMEAGGGPGDGDGFNGYRFDRAGSGGKTRRKRRKPESARATKAATWGPAEGSSSSRRFKSAGDKIASGTDSGRRDRMLRQTRYMES